MKMWAYGVAMGLLLSGCATTEADQAYQTYSYFGDAPSAAVTKKKVDAAKTYPLGSKENPVRVFEPRGERAYLNRLRCKDGKVPKYERIGSFGFGAFDNIIDGYDVRCEGSEPAQSMIYMDMYFPNYTENRAVPGFTIVP